MDQERATPPIASRGDFHKAIVAAFERAAAQGCREIFICDVDFAEWPLGERAVVDGVDAVGLQASPSHRAGPILR